MEIALAVAAVIVLLIVARSVRIASEWQRGVVLRLGRFHAVKGPGLYLVFPVVDVVTAVIDMRIQTTTITAEQALTRDTVAVGVDAIVFWKVSDAEAAAIRIANYREAIERVAQTTLREMIGATELSRLLSDRKAADEQLRASIGHKTADWGVGVVSVEIKDVSIPARAAGRDEPAGAGGEGEGCAGDARIRRAGDRASDPGGSGHVCRESDGPPPPADEPAL